MLRLVVRRIYSTPAWQTALLASPDQGVVDQSKPPGHSSLHWSMGAPPRLVAFAATIVSNIIMAFPTISRDANHLSGSCMPTGVVYRGAQGNFP